MSLDTGPDPVLDESHLTPKDVASPFLPDTKIQFAWDSTCLGLLKTCPRLYQYTIIEGWASRHESIHLRFGQEYHQALQEYDWSRANGVRHEDAIHDVVRALLERTFGWTVNEESKAGKYKNRTTLMGLVIDYLDHYREDPAETYIREDGSPAVELSFRFELDFGPRAGQCTVGLEPGDVGAPGPAYPDQPYLLAGHLDRVVNFNSMLLVLDHKTTTSTLSGDFFAQWEPSNQMTLYTLAGKTVLNAPIKGVMIGGAQILLTEPSRFVRGFTYRTDDQLNEWLDDLQLLLSINEHYAAESYWPMNDTSCDKFGGCKFRGVCSKSPDHREKFLKADFIKLPEDQRWNPLKAR
jgi:hypothetical protein